MTPIQESGVTEERLRELRFEHGDYRWHSVMPSSTLRVGEFLAICDELLRRRAADSIPMICCAVCQRDLSSAEIVCPDCRAAAREQGWRPISEAPKHTEALFWLEPKTQEEFGITDTSGGPIIREPLPMARPRLCMFGQWSVLFKATHWKPVAPPLAAQDAAPPQRERT